MPKFKTTPQTPKEDLLKGEFPSPKTTSPPKKAPPASTKPPKPEQPPKPAKGKRGCGMGIGGCLLGTCLGLVLAIAVIVGGISLASQSLLKNLPPELKNRLSSQEGIIEFLESLQTEGGLQKLLEESFEKSPQPFLRPTPQEFREASPPASPREASPSAQPEGL